jgi:aminoglycoside 3-N-acetyltransferase
MQGMRYDLAMSEADVVARSTEGPVTHEWLVRDLKALGVKPGMLLMVHASLSQLGWVVGGAVTVVRALREAVGHEGTIVMPTFSWDNSEPSRWRNPPVPESWWPVIRASMPAYDRNTPIREMGSVAEYFMHLPGVLRSLHPACSWAAQGPQAQAACAEHGLDFTLGENGPLGHCYELNGHALSLGCLRTTILHLAEYRAYWYGKKEYPAGCAMLVEDSRQWVEYRELHGDNDDFEQLRLDYMQSSLPGETWSESVVGYGSSRLFAIRPLVDFAVKWIEAHRKIPR